MIDKPCYVTWLSQCLVSSLSGAAYEQCRAFVEAVSTYILPAADKDIMLPILMYYTCLSSAMSAPTITGLPRAMSLCPLMARRRLGLGRRYYCFRRYCSCLQHASQWRHCPARSFRLVTESENIVNINVPKYRGIAVYRGIKLGFLRVTHLLDETRVKWRSDWNVLQCFTI